MMEIPKEKNRITKFKDSMEGADNRFDTDKERISELKGRSKEIT